MSAVNNFLRISVALVVAACSGGGPTSSPAQPTGSIAASPPAVVTPGQSAAASQPPGASPTAAPAATATAAVTATPGLTAEPPTPVPPTPAATESVAPSGSVVELIAGGGTQAPANGVAAIDALLQRPSGAAVAPDGSIWIVDVNRLLLMRIAPDGTLSDVTDGLYGPEGVTLTPDGTVYVADRGGYWVVKSDGSGGVDRVAGDPLNAGFRGDGGPARKALLWLPFDVAAVADGDLYIADSANQRIRVIDSATGEIRTIVGTGDPGFSGDGGLAVDAEIYGPQAIAVDQAASRLLIADTTNYRLRQVDLATGIISTIAGTGTGAVPYNPALMGPQTPITRIAALAMDQQGNAYFTVFWGDRGHMIMRLDPTGVLTPVVGGGSSFTPGVGAFDFALSDVLGLAIDPSTGALLICSSDGKVWRVPGVATPQI